MYNNSECIETKNFSDFFFYFLILLVGQVCILFAHLSSEPLNTIRIYKDLFIFILILNIFNLMLHN